MAGNFWAITAYFNPMHWRRRLANYRVFRRHLRIPLVAVELGYDGHFDLLPDDADILIQILSRDVMWQKERLLNIALAAVPPAIEQVASLDCDIILDAPTCGSKPAAFYVEHGLLSFFRMHFIFQPIIRLATN